jgi:hypothetical protein
MLEKTCLFGFIVTIAMMMIIISHKDSMVSASLDLDSMVTVVVFGVRTNAVIDRYKSEFFDEVVSDSINFQLSLSSENLVVQTQSSYFFGSSDPQNSFGYATILALNPSAGTMGTIDRSIIVNAMSGIRDGIIHPRASSPWFAITSTEQKYHAAVSIERYTTYSATAIIEVDNTTDPPTKTIKSLR